LYIDNFEILYTNATRLPNELKILVNADKIKPKVTGITEVKHKNEWNLLNSELKIEGCSLYSNDLSGNGHGVTLYVRDDIHCNLLTLLTMIL